MPMPEKYPHRKSPAARASRSETSRWADRAPVLRFLLRFGLLLGAFYAAVLLPWCDQAFYQYLRLNALVSGAILRGLGQDAQVAKTSIHTVGFAISIHRGCDALEPAWFFCAAVLAFPAPWHRKRAVLLVGTALILLLNLVRIVSLFYIGLRAPAFFPTAHLELWPAAFLLVALLLWIGWIRSVPPGGKFHVPAAP